jgi:ABC-2 type transport system ATP-binding protein
MYSALVIQDVTQQYGRQTILADCSLQVASGETYALLGPAGAGKTTLLRVVLGQLLPRFGRVQVLGSSSRGPRRIGWLPEGRPYLTHLTPRRYLHEITRVVGTANTVSADQISALLKLVGLSELADRPLAAAGPLQLQCFGLAQALLGEPELLLLDDPFARLDQQSVQVLSAIIAQARRRGQTMLITARTTVGIENLADRVGVLCDGAVVAEAAMAQLRGAAVTLRIRTSPLPVELQRMLRYLDQALQVSSQEILVTQNSAELQSRLLRILLDAGVTILALQPLESRLDRFYRRALSDDAADGPSGGAASAEQGLLSSLLTTPSHVAEQEERL